MNSSLRHSSFLVRLLAACLFWSLAVGAAASAEDFIKSKQSELSRTLQGGKGAEQARKVATVFDSMLDYDALARASLADHWETLTSAQQVEFKSVLKGLVQKAYRRNLDRTMNYDISYRGETSDDGRATVRTVAQNRKNKRDEAVDIDYVLHQTDGRWRVIDIVTEGVSLVKSYKRQFNSHIRRKGFDELLRKMKQKLESDD